MDYDKYLQHYSLSKESLIPLIDKVRKAKKNYETTFTDFLSPEEQSMLKSICFGEGMQTSFYGGKGIYERAIGAISGFEIFDDFPVKVIRITGNFKFEKLNHRDYLGSVLSLGIKREKIGDINVYEDGAEIWVHADIAEYIMFNLNKVKHTGIKTSLIDIHEARERIEKFKDKIDNIASLRLDSVVASAANVSRTNAVSLIKGGNVKLNYLLVQEGNLKVNPKDVLSIKGYGRYKIDSIIGTTRKDRITILIKQYV